MAFAYENRMARVEDVIKRIPFVTKNIRNNKMKNITLIQKKYCLKQRNIEGNLKY